MENNQNPESANNPFPASAGGSERSNLPLIGGVLVVLALAGLAFFLMTGMKQGGQTSMMETDTTQQAVAQDETAVAALSQQGTSDELSAIEADINATNLDSVSEFVDQL